jgi:hypothetical protein
VGLDPDSTYLIMSVWPIKNPRMALGAWWDVVTGCEQKYIEIFKNINTNHPLFSSLLISTVEVR